LIENTSWSGNSRCTQHFKEKDSEHFIIITKAIDAATKEICECLSDLAIKNQVRRTRRTAVVLGQGSRATDEIEQTIATKAGVRGTVDDR